MAIEIGTVKATKKPSQWSYIPDDRQEQVQLWDGVGINDGGCFEEGLTIDAELDFEASDFNSTLKNYWLARTPVTVNGPGGEVLTNRRIVVKGWNYVDDFESKVTVRLEIWVNNPV